MNKPKWTPGPWEADRIARGGAVSIIKRLSPAHLRVVATVFPNDANIISAAPELYEALRRLVPLDFGDHPEDFSDDWHRAVAAMAKARGE